MVDIVARLVLEQLERPRDDRRAVMVEDARWDPSSPREQLARRPRALLVGARQRSDEDRRDAGIERRHPGIARDLARAQRVAELTDVRAVQDRDAEQPERRGTRGDQRELVDVSAGHPEPERAARRNCLAAAPHDRIGARLPAIADPAIAPTTPAAPIVANKRFASSTRTARSSSVQKLGTTSVAIRPVQMYSPNTAAGERAITIASTAVPTVASDRNATRMLRGSRKRVHRRSAANAKSAIAAIAR